MTRQSLPKLLAEVRACRRCVEAATGPPLAHEPRPVLRAGRTARLAIFSQAPGLRAHTSGKPFDDPSGVRLRDWLGLRPDQFYDESRVAIVPMGFCFPGYDAAGGDLPPRNECAPQWRPQVLAHLKDLELALLIGRYAQVWHLPAELCQGGLTATVGNWRAIYDSTSGPKLLPLPHPSWRNSGWIKRNPWFGDDVLPLLKREVARLMVA